MVKRVLFFLSVILSLLLHSQQTEGQFRKVVQYSTDALFLVNPASGFLGSLAIEDYTGTKQVLIGGASSLAASYILKWTIRKERPDGSNRRSFPSAHTSISMHGAVFLHQRYGIATAWPAYVLTAYIGWGRIYAKKHDIWDVLGGAAIGATSALIFTRSFAKKHQITFSPVLLDHNCLGFHASLRF